MNIQKVYSEVLNALSSIKDNSQKKMWESFAEKENLTSDIIKKSAFYQGDVSEILLALKCDLEEEIRKTEAKNKGKKNYAAVKSFMKKCKTYANIRPMFAYAQKLDNEKFFICSPYFVFVTKDKDGLDFAVDEEGYKCSEQLTDNIRSLINSDFENGQTVELPYTVAQLKQYKKTKKPISLGIDIKGMYLGVKPEALIWGMQITGSNILHINAEKKFYIMKNDNGDIFGIMPFITEEPKMTKL